MENFYLSVKALKSVILSVPDFHDEKYVHLERFQVVAKEISVPISAEPYPLPYAKRPPTYLFERDHKLQDWILLKIEN